MDTRRKSLQLLLPQTRFAKSIITTTVCACLSISAFSAFAQEADAADEELEIIEVRGIADAYRNAIAEKRSAGTIVDALSSADIGALPDLSVAETLERITGVAGDRFKGNASEISIRGLGPFLGMSTVNGRAISSGSGNRSVAFSQFPSELVNGVVVYKAQKADILEGGVAGTIDLKTIRPLEFGKERFQAEMRVNHNEYHAKLDGETGLGYRPSVSYTNSYELDNGGKFGFAIGYAGSDVSTPEESYNTSSTLRNCNSDRIQDGGSNCNFSDSNNAANGGPAAQGDYYFIPNLAYYRQMKSEEERDGFIFAAQYQPNDDIDINLDGQFSRRFYFEDRHDLFIDDGRRRITKWRTNEAGALKSYTGESRFSSYGEYRERNEDYRGIGLNVNWYLWDRVVANFDASFSGTERWQTFNWARFRSDRLYFDFENGGSDSFANIANTYTDLNDPEGSAVDLQAEIMDMSFFSADSEARNERFEVNDEITAYKLDFDYLLDSEIFSSIKVGVSHSQRSHDNYAPHRRSLRTPSGERASKLAEVADSCSIPWQQDDWGEDANAPVSEWAVYDTLCAYGTLLGDNDLSVDPTTPSSGDVQMEEDITSLYAMTFFGTEWGDITVDGNFGVRHVTTDITSFGTRTSYSVTTGEDGTLTITENNDAETSVLENDYSNLLPSINVNFGLTDEIQLRVAAYAAISRPDMWYYGAARDISLSVDEDEVTTVAEALDGNVRARGNPFLEALESNNYDISLNYFANEDTMLSAAVYFKTFDARFESESAVEPVVVDGQSYAVTVTGRPTIVDDSSTIKGIELTAQHRFTSLPSPFDGLGFVVNYNYADSNFETPEAGSNISASVRPFIEPGNVAGLSDHTFSSQLYWEKGDWSARAQYKFRSDYLKPFGNNLGQTNRYVQDQSSLDFDVSYEINRNLKARFQVLNATNEPYVEERVVEEAFSRVEYSGRRFFVGLRYKM